jgi:hypothetical protein
MDVAELRDYGDRPVRVRLLDGSEHCGRLRTELLSELSLSIFIKGEPTGGATLYIDQIESVCVTDPTTTS